MRDIKVRLDVLRNMVKVTELRILSAPSVTMDANAEIKQTMSVDVQPNDVIDWLSDELQPVVTIDGAEYSFGIFAPATYQRTDNGIEDTVRVEAYDRCWRLKCMTTDHTLHFASGASYITTIKSLLTEAGIALTITTPSDLTLATDREDWNIGTDYLTIINDLLNEMSYNPLWFNAQGYAVLNPKEVLTGNPVRTYDFSNVSSLCKAVDTTVDLFNVPNVFICVCDSPDTGSAMTSTVENNNPASPLSIIRRGKRIVSFNSVNNIASQTALDNYAAALCYQNMLLGEQVSVTTALVPDCGMNEPVSIIQPTIRGMCRETGWSAELVAGGEMTHSLEAVALSIPAEEEEPAVTIAAIAGIAIAGLSIVGVRNNG